MEQLTELLNQYSIFGLPEQNGLLSFGAGSVSGAHCSIHSALSSSSGSGPLRKQRSQQLSPMRSSGPQLQHQHSAAAALCSSGGASPHSPPVDQFSAGPPLPTATSPSVDCKTDVNNNVHNANVSSSHSGLVSWGGVPSSLHGVQTTTITSTRSQFSQTGPSAVGDRSDSVDCAGCLCNECGCVERMLYLEEHWRSLVAAQGVQLPAKLQTQQDAIWELLSTELFYIRRLKVISDLFLNCLCNLQAECLLNDVSRRAIDWSNNLISITNFTITGGH